MAALRLSGLKRKRTLEAVWCARIEKLGCFGVRRGKGRMHKEKGETRRKCNRKATREFLESSVNSHPIFLFRRVQ